jgi:hypothetical protein
MNMMPLTRIARAFCFTWGAESALKRRGVLHRAVPMLTVGLLTGCHPAVKVTEIHGNGQAPSEIERLAEIGVHHQVKGGQFAGALRFLNGFLHPTHYGVVLRQPQMARNSVRVQLNGPLEFRAGGGEIKVIIEQSQPRTA